MTQYNRRTLVRGAAWSVPVIAIAANTPAFATSRMAPRPTSIAPCRITGGGNSNCYKFVLYFARPTESWDITLEEVFLTNTSTPNGEDVILMTTPTQFTVSSSPTATNVFEVRACTTGNLQSAVKLRLRYLAQTGAGVQERVTLNYDFTTINPC
jgi:hypothetical protein